MFEHHVDGVVESCRRLLAEEGFDRLVIHSGSLQPKSPFDDLDWPFRPVPSFQYLAPVPWPDCAIVIEPTGRPRIYALQTESFWEAPLEPDWELVESAFEVALIGDIEAIGATGWHGRSAYVGHEPREGLVGPTTAVNTPNIIAGLHEMRTRKSAWEIACIEQANLRAALGHMATARAFDEGERSELALHLAYLAASRQDDADCPYKNIVALGRNGATLHYTHYQTDPESASLLIDAGGTHLGYCSDITRTHVDPTVGPGAEQFARLADQMEQLQLRVIGHIEVGMNYEALHDFAHQELGRLLHDFGLVRCSPEAAVKNGITRAFFPHGLGHSLGVQVHDVGCRPHEPRPENRFLRNTSTIEAHQVFTIEPGLYFIDALLEPLKSQAAGDNVNFDLVETLRPFGGIRVEDDILVLEPGSDPRVRNLTREAFARAGAHS